MSRGVVERLTLGYLLIGALVYATVGVAGLLWPAWLMGLVGIPLAGAAAHNEIRAAYGGHMLALGAVMLVGLARPALRTPTVGLFVVSAGGFALGRLVSVVVDGAPEAAGAILWGMESAGLVGGLVLLALRARGPQVA